MKFRLFIARRYLFAKKSHNVINIISMISATGIAIGTAALIIILSVYNGFEELVKEIYSKHEADIVIAPAEGKTFYIEGAHFEEIAQHPAVVTFAPIVEENIFVRYGDEETVATIKGIDNSFVTATAIKEFVQSGEFKLYHGELPQAIVGSVMARNLGLSIHFVDPLLLYFPSRHRPLSFVNPSASLNIERLFPSAVFALDQEFDKRYIFIPIDIARDLLEYDEEVTSVELFLAKSGNMKELAKEFSKLLGDQFVVKDRFKQNETLYKMMKSEKLSIYLILFFVILIISCNLLGSLSMLIIEKRDDSKTLLSMGSSIRDIKEIFILEGWMISLLGVAIGAVVGVTLSLIQQHFGVISMPGNFIVSSYPVIIKWRDVLLSILGVSLIGLLTSLIPLALKDPLQE